MPRLQGSGPWGSTRLRRHGDEVERLPQGYYVAHGRSDDTMNLGGIKVRLPDTHIHSFAIAHEPQ